MFTDTQYFIMGTMSDTYTTSDVIYYQSYMSAYVL